MGMLEDLMGGGQRRKEYSDFINRYEQGSPSEGYSDQEVLKRYGEVSHEVPSDQYARAAQEALSKLSPEERAAFVKMLQDDARNLRERQAHFESQLLSVPAASWPDAAAKARYVLNLYAAGLSPEDARHRDLVAAILDDFARLAGAG